MCSYGLAAAAVLAAVGTAVSAQGAQQAQDARNTDVNNEIAIQNGIADQAKQRFASTLDQFSPQNQQTAQQQATDTRNTAITQAMAPQPVPTAAPTTGMTTGPGAPRVIGDTANLFSSNNRALAAGEGNALARTSSFGDLMTGNQINLDRSGLDLQNFAGNAQGQANLLPLQLQLANQQGQNLRTFGSLLGGIGSAAGSYYGGQYGRTVNSGPPAANSAGSSIPSG